MLNIAVYMFVFRLANKFGGSLGGCADGIPASQRGKQQQQGRNGKSTVEQAETDLMVSFPGGRGSNIDRELTGARNVNLRSNDEAVDLNVSVFPLILRLFVAVCSPLACLLLDFLVHFSSKE